MRFQGLGVRDHGVYAGDVYAGDANADDAKADSQKRLGLDHSVALAHLSAFVIR